MKKSRKNEGIQKASSQELKNLKGGLAPIKQIALPKFNIKGVQTALTNRPYAVQYVYSTAKIGNDVKRNCGSGK